MFMSTLTYNVFSVMSNQQSYATLS